MNYTKRELESDLTLRDPSDEQILYYGGFVELGPDHWLHSV